MPGFPPIRAGSGFGGGRPLSNGGGGLLVATLSLSRTQLSTLNTVPIAIVLAPGTGKILVPLWWRAQVSRTVASGGPAPLFQLRYGSPAVTATGPLSDLNSSLASAPFTQHQTNGTVSAMNLDPAGGSTAPAIVNQGLFVNFSAGPGAVFQATAVITLGYFLTTSGY